MFVEQTTLLWRHEEEINYNFAIPSVLNVNTQTLFFKLPAARAPRGLDTRRRIGARSGWAAGRVVLQLAGIVRKITFPSTVYAGIGGRCLGEGVVYAHTQTRTYKHDKKRPTKHKS